MPRKMVQSSVSGKIAKPGEAKVNPRETVTRTIRPKVDIAKFVGAVSDTFHLHALRYVVEESAKFPNRARLLKAIDAKLEGK